MIDTITQIPPSPEKLLCMMTDLFIEVKKEKDTQKQLKLLPMMSRISIYLHNKKHKNGHYITSPEAIRTLSTRECMKMMESIMTIGQENGGEEDAQSTFPGSTASTLRAAATTALVI